MKYSSILAFATQATLALSSPTPNDKHLQHETPNTITKRGQCWFGEADIGCSKTGYCWRRCSSKNAGHWCWLAWESGDGPWVACIPGDTFFCQRAFYGSINNPHRPFFQKANCALGYIPERDGEKPTDKNSGCRCL